MPILEHRDHEERPWGGFERFTLNELSTVKIIRVNPGAELSLQRHEHRAEFWRVLAGSGAARSGEETREIKTGDEVEVPVGALHRLSAGPEGLVVLEIAEGKFDEADIERLEDGYGRAGS
jgi:mannose-6-phosphate isomerase-like protein (cupin superfamily)